MSYTSDILPISVDGAKRLISVPYPADNVFPQETSEIRVLELYVD